MRNIDFIKYQSALIIGNGFDLSLGLSTSYMDFVNSDEFQILLNMQNQLAIYLKVNAELQNWIDIENELKLYSKNEDNAKCRWEPISLYKACWVESDEPEELEAFKKRKYQYMAKDREGRDVFLADSNYVLQMAQMDFKHIKFHFTSEF